MGRVVNEDDDGRLTVLRNTKVWHALRKGDVRMRQILIWAIGVGHDESSFWFFGGVKRERNSSVPSALKTILAF